MLVAVLLLAAGQMAASQPGHVDPDGPDADEYAIYSLLLNQLHPADSYVVINDHTTVKPFTRTKRKFQFAGGLPREIRADFETKNQKRYPLEDQFNLKVKTIFLSQEEIDKLALPEWVEFIKKYPRHGVIEFSRAGFNARRDRALVYTSNQGGPKSGAGFYVLLSKRNGNWQIDQKIFAWLS